MKVLPTVAPEPAQSEGTVPPSPIGQLLHLDEHTPLLIGGPEAGREDAEAMERGKDVTWTAVGMMKNWGFWSFGILLMLCIGPVSYGACCGSR
jgi:hypothetical protein